MQSFHFNFHSFPTVLLIMILLFSCKKDEDGASVIRFATSAASFSESDTDPKIGVRISPPRNVRTRIDISWTSIDTTTFMGGDFEMHNATLSLGSFDEIGYLDVDILEDTQLDSDDVIYFKLEKPSDPNVVLSNNPNETRFTFTIRNNDVLAPNSFQADLTWSRTNPYDRVTIMNMDLYVQVGVQFSGNTITEIGTTFAVDNNTGGFETINLKSTDPNQNYFLVVFFQQALLAEHVEYSLALNGFGHTNTLFQGRIDGEDVGTAIFYGPFRKSGSSLVLSGRAATPEVKEYRVEPGVWHPR